jgi:formylglycine-generating enzyme required for sulfatase activity
MLAAAVFAAPLQAQIVFDAAAEFSPDVNPNGAWSYGQWAKLSTNFEIFPVHMREGAEEAVCNWPEPPFNRVFLWIGAATSPSTAFLLRPVGGQPADFCTIRALPDTLTLHAGTTGNDAVLRWTAPFDGLAAVDAVFEGRNVMPTTSDVRVLHKGSTVFSAEINGFDTPSRKLFTTSITVLAGDTVDFTVGYGANGNNICDATMVDAVITLHPSGVSYVKSDLTMKGTWSPTTNTFIHRVTTSGTHAATLRSDGNVQWLDLKDPAKPLLLGTWEPFLMPSGVAVAGNLVYITSWELDFLSTVEIVDFSDPAKPVLKGYYDTPGYAQDVAIAGSRAYVADGEGGLHILDVSDPAFPQRLGGYDTKGSVDRVQVSGRYAYATVGNWVCVLDVSDPGNPRRAGVYEAPGGIQSLKVSGSKLYLAQQTGDLQILDVSDPGNIMLLGSYRSYGTEAIAVAGQFAYLAGSGGMHVLDVSNPTNITWLASVWKIAAEDVALMGNYAVVAGGDKGLAIYQLQQSIYPPLKPAVIAWGMVNMTWPFMEGARLQIATNLAKPFWQDIPESEGTNIVSLPLTEGAAFFRLAMGPKLTDRFVWIPPGTFTMGSPPTEVDRFDSEGPQTAVTISRGFWMGKYEVTQGEYESVIGTNPSWFTGDPNRPVEQVSWQDATAYCDALTQQARAAGRIPCGYDYRLPTEAEWEYACRAGTSTRFSYGDDHGYTNLINYGWWDGNSGGTTRPVGQKLPNPWGLHEMHGNVWEWCQDWWSESLPGGIAVDPQGPATGPGRMGRGGGWDYNAKLCRSAFRAHFGGPGSWFVDVGFRIVLAQGQP